MQSDTNNDIARMIGHLEGKLVARFDEHGRALKTVAEEVARQGRRIETIEQEHERLKKTGVKSAHDLSELAVREEQTNEAIKRHLAVTDKKLQEIATATKGQDDVLAGQNKVLTRIDRVHPMIIVIATAIGAAISGFMHH